MKEKVREEMDGRLRKFRLSLPEDDCVVKLQEYCKFYLTLLKIKRNALSIVMRYLGVGSPFSWANPYGLRY